MWLPRAQCRLHGQRGEGCLTRCEIGLFRQSAPLSGALFVCLLACLLVYLVALPSAWVMLTVALDPRSWSFLTVICVRAGQRLACLGFSHLPPLTLATTGWDNFGNQHIQWEYACLESPATTTALYHMVEMALQKCCVQADCR